MLCDGLNMAEEEIQWHFALQLIQVLVTLLCFTVIIDTDNWDMQIYCILCMPGIIVLFDMVCVCS